MRTVRRRDFLKGALGAAGAAATLHVPAIARAGTVLGANERFRIAVCGLNGRGGSHIGGFGGIDGVELAYLVEPDQTVLARKLEGVRERVGEGYEVKGEADVRKVLEDKTIDAITVAAPNHWHSLMTIWAAQAGKHCYVEKPASHDIYEGRVALEAWKKYGIVIQHGTQSRSSARIAGLHEAIQSGKFGKLKIAYGYCCKPRGGIGMREPKDPPPNLDWNLWRGPAVVKDYHDNYVHYNWHWFWNTGNGDLNNQGTHQLDIAYWAIDKDQTHPKRVMALGGRFKWDDQGETPNSMFAIAEYPNGQSVFFNVRNVNYRGYQKQVTNEYYFEDGGRIVDEGGYRYYAKGSDKGERIDIPDGKVTPGGNWESFIAACRAGDPMMANGNMRDAHYSCVLGHLMNNSYRLGEEVPFNEKAGRFGDNKDAHEHFMKLHEVMRDGCEVPVDEARYTVGPWLTFDAESERFTGEHSEKANKLVRDPSRKGFEIPDVNVV
jgi:predicted dehydrogenase